uniref:Pgi-like protein 1 n=1 Tax=Parasacculina yatsui TaxID=2836420 RepID=A0A8K1VE82_9CRUS|nr:Pgi-like protein 1 [Parasacculina yatsui]
MSKLRPSVNMCCLLRTILIALFLCSIPESTFAAEHEVSHDSSHPAETQKFQETHIDRKALYSLPDDARSQRGNPSQEEGDGKEMDWAQVEYLPDVETIQEPVVNRTWPPPRFGVFTYSPPKINIRAANSNPLCRTSEGLYGVCYSEESCYLRGGRFNSQCHDSQHICCHFESSCSIETNERVSYYRNPSFPGSDSGNMMCNYQVNVAEDVCGVRVDFLNYSTPVLASCSDTQLVIMAGSKSRTQPICGVRKGYSVTVPMKADEGPLVLSHTLGGPSPYSFNIRITQLRCSALNSWMTENHPMCGILNEGRVRHKRFHSSGLQSPEKRRESRSIQDELMTWESLNITREMTGIPWQRFSHSYLQEFIEKLSPSKLRSSTESLWRILGGMESVRTGWQVAISIKKRLSMSYFCGGMLISRQHVLTAAHCLHRFVRFPYEDIRRHIVFGVGDFKLDELTEADSIFRLAKSISIHHGWDANQYHNDIAVVELNRPVKLREGGISPICLPLGPLAEKDYTGETATLRGWGVTSFNVTPGNVSQTLKSVDLTVVNTTVCRKIWKRADSPRTVYEDVGTISDQQMCLSSTPGAACFGDSGGPSSYQTEDGRQVALGVVSFGPPTCQIGGQFPSIHTFVPKYLDWIRLSTLPLLREEPNSSAE